ncbi:MAG: DUF4476 domain-containing protein [Deltaproteobacteria bacterium]|nr:DUF4476 domain-containing protein [Deltaproteobacteria bacterium]
MTMTRLVALAALLIAVPSLASRPSSREGALDQARQELIHIERLSQRVQDPRLRAQLADRIGHVDGLLVTASQPVAQGLRMDEMLSMVEAESFDSGRVQVIRRIARSQRISSEQAALLTSRCAFDSSRMEALIALYPAVTDPWRFEVAVQVLTFASSREEVWRQIEGS